MRTKIGQRDAEAGNWNKPMSMAYSAGLKAGKAGLKNRATNYAFPAAYRQGYRHGKASRKD